MITLREASDDPSQLQIGQVESNPQEVFFVTKDWPRRYWMRSFGSPGKGPPKPPEKGYVNVVCFLTGLLERFPNDTLVTLVDVEMVIHPKGELSDD